MKPKIQVIIGSIRQGRQGEKVANWVFDQIRNNDALEIELVDLKDYPLEFYNAPSTPKLLNETYQSELANKWVAKVGEADGYIIVTPEYNHGYPASLKNALDYPYASWNKKPVAFVSYGGPGAGLRVVEQLRLVSIELQMAPIQESVWIPYVRDAFEENGKIKDESYNARLRSMFDQLSWWVKALKSVR